MAPVVTSKPVASKSKPRVLIVDDEPALLQLMKDIVGGGVDCHLIAAKGFAEAKKVLETQQVELLLTDLHLPDGDGMSLVPKLKERSPTASAVIVTGEPSINSAVHALRSGADDFVCKPFNAEHLIDRVSSALRQQAAAARGELRVDKLRSAVKRLNSSRKTVSKKVDLLCNDLVSAYGELARQLDDVRNQESFRRLLGQAKDLEQLLCHAMDWMLKQLGYTNVAVWLAAEDSNFQLGAYMKYTIPGDQPLTDALRDGLVQNVVKSNLIHVTRDNMHDVLSEDELDLLADQTMIGANCSYLGESLAAVVLFRDHRSPFSVEDLALVKAICPIFATALASIVKRTGNVEDMDGQDSEHESDFLDGGLLDADEGPEHKKPKKKADDADWWKRGESPPF